MNRRTTTPPGGAVVGTVNSTRTRLSRPVSIRLLATLAPFMLACGESDAMMVGVSDVPETLSITVDYLAPGRQLDSPEQLVLEVGDSVSVSATALNALGLAIGDAAVTWLSSDAGVVDVTAGGLVTAIAAGVAEISASVDGVSTSLQTLVNGEVVAPIPDS